MFGKPVTSLDDFWETPKASRFEMSVGVSLSRRCCTRWLQFYNVIAKQQSVNLQETPTGKLLKIFRASLG